MLRETKRHFDRTLLRDMRFVICVTWLLGLFTFGACDSLGPVERDPTLCPQTGEFANHGCARLAAILTTAAGAPAPGIALRGILLDSASAGTPSGLASDLSDAMGRVGLQLTWFVTPPKEDTVHLRVVAIRPGSPGVSPQRIDSLDVRVVFARVGQRPQLDTLRWQLRQ